MVMKKVCIYALLPAILVCGCGKKAEEYTVMEEAISESVYASGFVKSKNQYQVHAKASGLVEELYVKEGDLLKKGDPILRLTNNSSKLNAANARLALQLANENARGEKLKELQVNIDLTRNKYLNDSLLLERQKTLWQQKIGTQVELEQRELAFKSSRSAYQNALLRYSDTQKTLDFQSEQALNNSRISESMEEDFIVRSETDGRLFTLLKEKGEMVSPLNPIAVVGDDSEFSLELQVDEYDITRVKPGQEIVVGLDSYKGQVFKAKVSRVNSIMNERSRSFTVDANFIDKPAVLYPNLTAEANIIIQSKNKVLTVPRSYLIGDSLVLDQKKQKIKVVTGLKDYKKAEIVNGLKANDVITKPQ